MDSEPLFKNGHWVWDEENVTLRFVSHDVSQEDSISDTGILPQQAKQAIVISSIKFKEDITTLERLHYRRHYLRKIDLNEPAIITLQDVKDVAIFIANRKDLTPELITYLHLPEIDKFFRAMIVYFHFFLQFWEQMLLRREEAIKKLRQPVVTELENITRDNLADLRSMVGREYRSILLGIGKVEPFHHLEASGNSLAEKDRRIFESLICMTVRVVWIALQRRSLSLIDLEIHKMLRTEYFNIIAHRNKPSKLLWRSDDEQIIIKGISNIEESKLKQRSSAIKELLYWDYDHRMVGAGIKHFEPASERSLYLESLYAIPDEDLLEHGFTVGLIGIPREYYNCVLLPRERTNENFDQVIIEPMEMKFPPRVPIKHNDMPKCYPKQPSHFHESIWTIRARKNQCRMWKQYIAPHQDAKTLDVFETDEKTSL